MKKRLLLMFLLLVLAACEGTQDKKAELFITASLESQDFEVESLKIVLNCTEDSTVRAYYSLDDTDVRINGIRFNSGDEIKLGEELERGESVQLNIYLRRGSESIQKTYIYSKIGLYINADPSGGFFAEDYVDVVLNIWEKEGVIGKYSFGDIDPKTEGIEFASGTIIRIGEDLDAKESKKLNLYAILDGKELTETYNFRKMGELSDDIDNLRIYQIMVCSFRDGDSSIGYQWQWNQGQLAGGDLQGIIDSLDHIEKLGINAIWMTPVFETTSAASAIGNQAHNGYFANNYFRIDPRFGTNAKFVELVEKAHEKGMYVFLDGVFGHNAGGIETGNPNIVASPISGVAPTTSNPVNYQDANTLQFYKDVAYYWIKNYKIDGWRLDQSYQLGPGSNIDTAGQGAGRFYWDDIRESVEEAAEENRLAGERWGTLGYMVGEDWEGENAIVTNTYGSTNERGLASAFDFPMRYRIVQSLAREESGNGNESNNRASSLDSGFDTHGVYPTWAHPNLMIGNHDLARFGDLVDYSSTNSGNYWERHKAVFSFQAAYSGPITLYYGEEIGLKTNVNNASELTATHISRVAGKFTNYTSEEQDLYEYITKIMEIRNNHPALWQEDTRTNILSSGDRYVDYKYDRETGDKVIFALNCYRNNLSFSFNISDIGTVKDAITGEEYTGPNFTIPMAGLQSRFLIVQ